MVNRNDLDLLDTVYVGILEDLYKGVITEIKKKLAFEGGIECEYKCVFTNGISYRFSAEDVGGNVYLSIEEAKKARK